MSDMTSARWAVIFPNRHTGAEAAAYQATAQRMVDLAHTIDGFCGIESVRGDSGNGITVSYWESTDAISAWREHPEHLEAQRLGREQWYASFDVHVAEIHRSYHFDAD